MKTLIYVLGLSLAASSAAVLAHVGGHSEPPRVADCKHVTKCTQDEVTRGGLAQIAKLVSKGKLNKSWADVKTASSAKRQEGRWIVGYQNPKEADKAKQTFYLYISEDGSLEGANYTGQ